MNRLVIIGNGFDLAHGLKTSYGDFILEYFRMATIRCISNRGYKDLLLLIEDKSQISVSEIIKSEIKTLSTVTEIMQLLKANNFNILLRGGFVTAIFNNIENLNWVDIEQEYYNELISIAVLENDFSPNRDKMKKGIQTLNEQFEYLKGQLDNYLNKIRFKIDDISKIHVINSKLEEYYTNRSNRTVKGVELKKTFLDDVYFINFNYTNLYSKYLTNHFHGKVVNIHGQLNDRDNPIIFGLGDEMFKDQYQIQEYNINEFYQNFKSIAYLKTSSYQNMLNIIDKKEFEVYIMGHSCGISDRTLLNKIFEHKNCMSIRVFYHQRENDTNDYHDKIINIYRHFNDKSLMRELVVPFDQSRPLID